VKLYKFGHSSLGVYSGKLEVPLDAFGVGIAATFRFSQRFAPVAKSACGASWNLVASRRLNLKPLLIHDYDLDHIADDYDVFGNRKDGPLKVAIRPKL
jgi:threonine dehydrogenase-like Zn-dependent dehydrogenase